MTSLCALLYLCSLNPWKQHKTASPRRQRWADGQFIPQRTGVNVVLVNRIIFLLGPDSCVTVELALSSCLQCSRSMPASEFLHMWVVATTNSHANTHLMDCVWSFKAWARDLPSPEWLFVRCLITELRKVTRYPQELVSFVEGDVLHGTHFL